MDVTLPDRVEAGTGLALYKTHRPCEGGIISVMNCDQQSLCLSPLSFLTHFQWSWAPHGQSSCAHTTAMLQGPCSLSCHFYAYFLLPLSHSRIGHELSGSLSRTAHSRTQKYL